jgi:hypothetical protein
MKKQISIIAAITIAIVIFSCSRKNSDITPSAQSPDAQVMGNQPGSQFLVIDPLTVGLSGRYEFDASLKDLTHQLSDAISNKGYAWYTTDRKGNAQKAVKLDGKYQLDIPGVPHSTAMSVSAWIKYDDALAPAEVFICSTSDGPHVEQFQNQYMGYNNPTGNPWIGSGAVDNKWHHVVVTIDGTNLKFYVDGNLVGTTVSPETETDPFAWYHLGTGPVVFKYWRGAIDDFRIYSRTLSASEVTSLFNL